MSFSSSSLYEHITVHLISISTTWICKICMQATKVSVLEVWHLVWINFFLFSMRCLSPRAEIKSCMQVGFAVIQKEEFQHGESEHREPGLISGVLLPNLTPADTTFSFTIFRLYICICKSFVIIQCVSGCALHILYFSGFTTKSHYAPLCSGPPHSCGMK